MIVANIFTTLGSKIYGIVENVPLLFLYNMAISSFLISLKLGSLKGLERKWISSILYRAYFIRTLALSCAAVYRRGGANLEMRKCHFKQNLVVLKLFKINFVAEFLSVQKLWLFTLLTLPSSRLCT